MPTLLPLKKMRPFFIMAFCIQVGNEADAPALTNDNVLDRFPADLIVLSALEAVDSVCVFSQDTPLELIKIVKPDILVKGADYKNKEVVGSEYAGKVVLFPLLKGRSTTNLINKMAL